MLLHRLALLAKVERNVIWEKITAIMMDSVTKNLDIENLIAASLYSNHIPLHILCVSHTCEVFDTGNLYVLSQVEKSLKLKESLLKYMPSLQSFLQKTINQAAINALSNLVTNDGHKSSLYAEFDEELEKVNKTKKFSSFN